MISSLIHCAPPVRVLRYPGGKQRQFRELRNFLPDITTIRGRLVEPFLGGAAIFFGLRPLRALLADLNQDLIEFYTVLRESPTDLWDAYLSLPAGKEHYYRIRDADPTHLDLICRAARLLYLNRTCYKGMWRYNSHGRFNVGYGGEARRLAISRSDLLAASTMLKNAVLCHADFEEIIDSCTADDFLFVDPPYKPGARELTNHHYLFNCFSFTDHQRLATALHRSTARGVRWGLTTSSHPEVLALFPGASIITLDLSTSYSPGILSRNAGEAFVYNFDMETHP